MICGLAVYIVNWAEWNEITSVILFVSWAFNAVKDGKKEKRTAR